MSKYVFKAEDIEVDNPKAFEVPRGSQVIVNHIHLMKDGVSKIEGEKIKQYPDTIFINLYSGNVKIADVVAKDPYVLEIDTIGNALKYYDIRLANELDKEERNGQTCKAK